MDTPEHTSEHTPIPEESARDTAGQRYLQQWRATRLIDERTGNSCIGIDFPRRQPGRGFEVFDDDLVEQPKKVRALLKSRGAVLFGTKDKQIRFIQRVLKEMAPKPLTLAMKPGLRGRDGFVLGECMVGTAADKFRWRSASGAAAQGELGDCHGSQASWNLDVGEVALRSTFLTFGLSLSLACPLPSYVLARSSQRLLSETAVFNLSGGSGSGKTSVVRAAAGVLGPPHLVRKWDFSRRGLEEHMESRNDLLAAFDDVETHTDESTRLQTAIRHVNQIPTSGQSKLISQRAEMPQLFWLSFGLTSSPDPIDVIAERSGLRRTDGQRVRLIDIPVPKVDEAGIFDHLDGDPREKIAKGKDLIARLDDGVTKNFGLIMPLWLRVLFEEDRSSLILRGRDLFLKRVISNGTGFDERYAAKSAIPAIAGYLAAAYKIVPWPKMWPIQAAEHCYYLAVKAVRRDADVAANKLLLIAKLAGNPNRFVPAKHGASEPIALDDPKLGVRTTYQGQNVLAFRDEPFDEFAGSLRVLKLMIEQLRLDNALLGGHGHAGTTQLPIPIKVGDRTIGKPRFWVLHLGRLRAAMARAAGS
jgi:Domain of unknown function (DUF927)